MFAEIPRLKVLSLFFDEPYSEYYLRELARKSKTSPMSLKRSLDFLVSEELVLERKRGNLNLFKANMENLVFKHLKTVYNLEWLKKKKLVRFVLDKLSGVSSIVLFGSYAKGENDKNSDLDLVVICMGGELKSTELKELVGVDVNLLVFKPSEWSKKAVNSKPFYLDVITGGIALHGYLPVEE